LRQEIHLYNISAVWIFITTAMFSMSQSQTTGMGNGIT